MIWVRVESLLCDHVLEPLRYDRRLSCGLWVCPYCGALAEVSDLELAEAGAGGRLRQTKRRFSDLSEAIRAASNRDRNLVVGLDASGEIMIELELK